MKKTSILSVLVGLLATSNAFAYGTGQSMYPIKEKQKLISAEFTGITSTGGGLGFQGRFTHKFNDKITGDIGVGFAGGERTGRVFVGGDFEVLPDYRKQPRVSVRGQIENSREFNKRKNIVSIAPTVSKGFSFWGEEAYPYFSLPLGLSLDSEDKSYDTVANAAVGIIGNIPFEGYRKLVASIEGTVGLKGSQTGVFVAVSYPID